MTVMGIDPGYGRLGWAVIRDGRDLEFVAAGCVETSPDDAHARRLAVIAAEVRAAFELYRPERVVVEQVLFTKNQTTAIGVAEARGVVLAVAGAFDTEVVCVGPMQVKQAVTGNGHAGKGQVQEMVARMLHLERAPAPDDAADACAVAIAGSHR